MEQACVPGCPHFTPVCSHAGGKTAVTATTGAASACCKFPFENFVSGSLLKIIGMRPGLSMLHAFPRYDSKGSGLCLSSAQARGKESRH